MFSCNVDEILNDLPGVAFIDKAADWKATPIGGFNMPPEHSGDSDVQVLVKSLHPHVELLPGVGGIAPVAPAQSAKKSWRLIVAMSVAAIAAALGYLGYERIAKKESIQSVTPTSSPASVTLSLPSPSPPSVTPSLPPHTEIVARAERIRTLFATVHEEYVGSFKEYRQMFQDPRHPIDSRHPVFDAINRDQAFTGARRAELLALLEGTDTNERLGALTAAVRSYLSGIETKTLWHQRLPNAPRQDLLKSLRTKFALEESARLAACKYQLKIWRRDPVGAYRARALGAPLVEALEEHGACTPALVDRQLRFELPLRIDEIVNALQAEYMRILAFYHHVVEQPETGPQGGKEDGASRQHGGTAG